MTTRETSGTKSAGGVTDDVTRIAPVRGGSDDDATQIRSDIAADPDATRVAPIRSEHGVLDSAGTSSWERVGHLPNDVQVGVGMVLKGRFLLEREIGRGGMGVVYLARDARKVEARDRNPYIAVKVLNDEFRQHPDALVALQRESRRAQRLAHDHIVRVYDFDKDGPIVFMTMEYVHGGDLRGLIRGRQGKGLPMLQAWRLIEGMGKALLRAHAAGIVHSDFKPGNVMVGDGSVAKVFDFGIARVAKLAGADAGDDRTLFDATSLGAMTPAYASPEMLLGQEPAFADDVYAFGCVVYELLAGRHPFDKRTAEQAREQGQRPAPLPGLSRGQNAALRRALAFDAQQRPDMATLLARLRPRRRRERWLRLVGVGLLVLGLAVISFGLLHLHVQRQQVARVLEGLTPRSAQRFADETEAGQALAALDEEDRRRLILDHGALVEAFLLARLDAYWQPAQGRLDYAGALRVLALRERWRLFSPRLEGRREALRQERDHLLNSLDTRLSQAVAAGRLTTDQPDNVVALLTQIRSIAPDSGLLRHAELELRYEHERVRALERGDREAAQRWLSDGLKAFPGSARLQARAAEVRRGTAPASTPERDNQALAEAGLSSRIESLRTAAAANDVEKVRDLLAQIAAIRPDHPILSGEGRERLAEAYLGRARALARQGRWRDAQAATEEGVSVVPTLRLRRADALYTLAVDLSRFGTTVPDAAQTTALSTRVRRLRAQDPSGYRTFAQDLADAKGGRNVAALLARLERKPEAPAPDPCRISGQSGNAGNASRCTDALGTYGQGPALVVLPSASGRTLAMMRSEISFADLAPFCRATAGCELPRRSRSQAAADDISLAMVEQYAAWLSQTSGYRYRLPRDEEWLNAALAGGSRAACEKAVSNRWGLLNMAGGLAEWVRGADGPQVRGGGHRADACGGAAGKISDGKAERGLGARLVRDIK